MVVDTAYPSTGHGVVLLEKDHDFLQGVTNNEHDLVVILDAEYNEALMPPNVISVGVSSF